MGPRRHRRAGAEPCSTTAGAGSRRASTGAAPATTTPTTSTTSSARTPTGASWREVIGAERAALRQLRDAGHDHRRGAPPGGVRPGPGGGAAQWLASPRAGCCGARPPRRCRRFRPGGRRRAGARDQAGRAARVPRRDALPARLPRERRPAGRRHRRPRRRLHGRLRRVPRKPAGGDRAAARARTTRPAWDEPGNHARLVDAAMRAGADWAMSIDADERVERDFRARAERVIAARAAPGPHRVLRPPPRAVGLARRPIAPTASGTASGHRACSACAPAWRWTSSRSTRRRCRARPDGSLAPTWSSTT